MEEKIQSVQYRDSEPSEFAHKIPPSGGRPRALMLDALRIRFAVEFNGQSNYVQRPQRTMCSGHKELCAVAAKNYVQWPKNYVQRPQRTMCSDR